MSASNHPTRAKAISDIAVGTRMHDPERVAKGRRDLAEAKIAAYVERTLAEAPPLSPAQITRLRGLLRSGGQR